MLFHSAQHLTLCGLRRTSISNLVRDLELRFQVSPKRIQYLH
jgi:hypothetical protein